MSNLLLRVRVAGGYLPFKLNYKFVNKRGGEGGERDGGGQGEERKRMGGMRWGDRQTDRQPRTGRQEKTEFLNFNVRQQHWVTS